MNKKKASCNSCSKPQHCTENAKNKNVNKFIKDTCLCFFEKI